MSGAPSRPRAVALVPAAGTSTRMGQPKLLLPIAGQPLIARVIRAWQAAAVDRVVVVVRPGDAPLAEAARAAGADVVIPAIAPPDMKASLQAGLAYVEASAALLPPNAFLVAPADMPNLAPAIIRRLIGLAEGGTQQILVPTLAGRRGHPVLFPWALAAAVHTLPPDEGISALYRQHQPRLVPCDDLTADGDPFGDLDTPEDYARVVE